jgi:hypothetical protein
MPWKKKVYALYKGENFIADGTIQEIHDQTKKSITFLRYMTFPAYERKCRNGKNRLVMVNLEDE